MSPYKIKINSSNLSASILFTVGMVFSLLTYLIILRVGVPQQIGLSVRYGLFPVIVAIILFYPAFRLSGRIGTVTSLSLTLVLFALPLSGLWNSGTTEYFVIGGLLPWSDASNYYHDARLLLEGNTFSLWGSNHRPLFSGVLAVLLGLTQQNLQIALAIIVLITAISGFLLVREIQRSHGTMAGLIVLIILFLFYRPYIGLTTTENLGLALGATGLAVIWQGTGQKHINTILLGIFLLTLALNARAGAFFVLPMLILWGSLVFRGQNRISGHFLVGGIIAVIVGFLSNLLVLKIAGHPDGVPNSNFSYILYGLAVGGKGWQQIYTDHPGVSEASEIYRLAFEVIRTNPSYFITGLLQAFHAYLNPLYGAFGFIGGSYIQGVDLLVRFGVYVLSFWGLLRCYCQWHNLHNSLVFTATLGILLSVPFLADGGVRVYAATIPFSSILVMLGTVPIITFITNLIKKADILIFLPPSPKTSKFPLIFGIALAMLTILGPILTKIISKPPQFVQSACSTGQETRYVRITPGSSITAISDPFEPAYNLTWLPSMHLIDFQVSLKRGTIELTQELEREITADLSQFTSITIMNLIDLEKRSIWERYIWLIANSRIMPQEPGIVKLCGHFVKNLGYGFFYADSIQKVSE
jgi:hypothetical protein